MALCDYPDIEQAMRERGFELLCGVDEVGRGPLAGPVVAAAVMLPPDVEIDGLDDSKKLSAEKREELFAELIRREVTCAVGIMDNDAIDRLNILRASLMAMHRAVTALKQRPQLVLVDGSHAIPNLTIPQCTVVGGDGRCRSIAAASIVAKVTRDRIMTEYEQLYPDFSFATHKGYPTRAHLEELRRFGVTDIHRRSFRPVAERCEQYALF